MPPEHVTHLAEGRRGWGIPAGERQRQVAEQPRASQAAAADDDAVAPGGLDHPEGVRGLPDVAVAEHGDGGDGGPERGDRRPVRSAGVVLLCRAGVERDRGRPLVLGDAARVDERAQAAVDADPQLHRDGCGAGAADRGAHDVAEQGAAHGQRSPAALPRHLGHRATEIEVDVVGALLPGEEPGGLADRPRLGAVQLDRPHRLVVGEAGQAEGLGVALGKAARSDHLADEQAAGFERPAQPPERRVGDARHRRQHHRRPHPQGADAQRGPGDVPVGVPVKGHGVWAHRSVIAIPRSASSVRSSGSDSPITVPWLPSIPVTKGAPYPSIVHAPATVSGSPVAMYASISASDGLPKCTTVSATPDVRRPLPRSMTAWPEVRTPDRPRCSRHQARAWSADAGLPRTSPSISSRESHPTTSGAGWPGSVAPWSRRAIAAALRSASMRADSPVESPATPSSATPLTMTSGSRPAARSRARRAGEAEARTRRRMGTPASLARVAIRSAPRAPIACRAWTCRPPTPRSSWPTGWSGSAGRPRRGG